MVLSRNSSLGTKELFILTEYLTYARYSLFPNNYSINQALVFTYLFLGHTWRCFRDIPCFVFRSEPLQYSGNHMAPVIWTRVTHRQDKCLTPLPPTLSLWLLFYPFIGNDVWDWRPLWWTLYAWLVTLVQCFPNSGAPPPPSGNARLRWRGRVWPKQTLS